MYVSKVYEYAVDSYGDVRTLVRGLPYQCPDDWEEVLDSIDEDSNLYLIKEPDNPKDPLAIAAYLDDRRVGYVAASDNKKIWLYMTDEKMPCTFIERFEASFKISFENPRSQFEGMSFEDIYRDKDGVTEEPYADFEIPFLTNPKNKNYDWYDDQTYIMDLEKFIPDFRRKLAARLIIFAGRKNSEGEYCYYLPYSNNPVADINDDIIKGLIDEHGFVIALPDVPMKTERGGIIMDLHVTYLTGIIFWTFDSMHHSEFVFHLTQETEKQPKANSKKSAWMNKDVGIHDEPSNKGIEEGESYEVTDSPDGGKNVSMNVIVPEDGDEDFEFCTYECRVRDNKQIDIITEYMKRFEEGKESRPFLMIGRPCLGLDNTDIFYSLDGEIIFNFIFDDKIKRWIREAGFVLGKVKSYKQDAIFPEQLAITLSVSKRKGGETLFKEASEEAMDYIEEYCSSQANHDVEARIIDAVEKYMSGDSATSYKVVIIPQYGIGSCTTLDGEDIAIIVNNEIIELAEKNKGVFGYITKVDYDDDGDAWFTIRVSRSIPRLTLESLADSLENSSSAINDFFPIFGFTLGKTTWKQAEDMGHVVEIWKEGPRRYTDVGDIRFEDEKGEGVFTFLMWLQGNTDFPPLWKSKGFSWNLSYDEWTVVFKKLGFKVTESRLNEINSESASFEALSSDGALSFELNFFFGENGQYTSSPKTLHAIYVSYKGPITVGANHVNSETNEKAPEKVNQDEKDCSNNKIQDAVLRHCILEVLEVNLTNTPNSKWEYESWNIFGGGYETYIFSAPDGNTGKYKKCEAIVNRNRNNNYKFIGLNADTVLSLLYHYRRVFDSSYKFEQCKKEYCKILDDSYGSILITDTTPWLSIDRSDGYSIGDSKKAQYDVLLYTSLYNKEYIDTLISQGKLITIF